MNTKSPFHVRPIVSASGSCGIQDKSSQPTPRLIPNTAHYVCLVGAQKSGTTSLYQYLSRHPAIHAIRWKESKFFLKDVAPAEDVLRFNDLAAGWTPDRWLFETSTYYTKRPAYSGVPKRIARSFPEARIIYLVRNPIDRIWSQYCDYLSRNRERDVFEKAIEINSDYFDFSRYHMQISQYNEVFPRNRILVMVFEDFFADLKASLQAIFEFLEIDSEPSGIETEKTHNSSASKFGMSMPLRLMRGTPGHKQLPWRFRKWITRVFGKPLPNKNDILTPQLRSRIANELRTDIEKFYAYFGRPVEAWKEDFGGND